MSCQFGLYFYKSITNTVKTSIIYKQCLQFVVMHYIKKKNNKGDRPMFFLLNPGERQSFIIKQNLFSFMLVYIDLIKHFSVLIKYSFFLYIVKSCYWNTGKNSTLNYCHILANELIKQWLKILEIMSCKLVLRTINSLLKLFLALV